MKVSSLKLSDAQFAAVAVRHWPPEGTLAALAGRR